MKNFLKRRNNMNEQELRKMIEDGRRQIAKIRADIERQKNLALRLLLTARNEKEIRVQQEILLRLSENEAELGTVEQQWNRVERMLSIL
jgi:hypothetical protein